MKTKILAILLALLLALGTPACVMAEGTVDAGDGASQASAEDINTKGVGIKAGENGPEERSCNSIRVEGESTESSTKYATGIEVSNGSSVVVTGDTTVTDSDKSTGVSMKNPAGEESGSDGKKANTVTIGKDLKVEAEEEAYGIDIESDNNVATVKGNVTVDTNEDNSGDSYGIVVFDSSENKVSIGGDLSASGEDTYAIVLAETDNNLIEIDGNVTSDGIDDVYGIYLADADNNTINVKGITTVNGDYYTYGILLYDSDGNEIVLDQAYEVTGKDGGAIGVYSLGSDNDILINGDLSVTQEKDPSVDDTSDTDFEACGIYTYYNNNTVTVNGDVDVAGTEGFAIGNIGYGNTIDVKGDAKFNKIAGDNDSNTLPSSTIRTYAIDRKYLIPDDESAEGEGQQDTISNSTIIVRGTVGSVDGTAIFIEDETEESDLADCIPEIYVHTIDSDDDEFITVYNWKKHREDETYTGEAADPEVYKAINYIVDTNEIKHGKLVLQGVKKMDDGTYYANEDEVITVSIQIDDGYKLKNVTGGIPELVRGEDGNYTLTVPRGGGITIDAIIEAVEQAEAESKSSGSSKKALDIELYRDLDVLEDRKALQLVRSINGVNVHGDATSFAEADKYEDIDDAIAEMIKAVEGGDLTPVTCELDEGTQVISQALRLEVAEKKDLRLYLENAPANAKVLYYDLTTGEWSIMGNFNASKLAKVTLTGSGFAFAIA